MCDFRLEDDGEFEARLSGGDDASDEFYVDYPELNRALDLWSGPIVARDEAISFTDPDATRKAQHHDKAIADAVEKERTRLIVKLT